MDEKILNEIIEKISRELQSKGLIHPVGSPQSVDNSPIVPPRAASAIRTSGQPVSIDLEDPTRQVNRMNPGVKDPNDKDGLIALMNATPARIGAGRAGARYRTNSLLLFQADLAVTHDTLLRDVDQPLLDSFQLFQIQTCITGGKDEYLLRPDLGRKLNDEARAILAQRCKTKPNIQVCVGDGLSAAAIEANLAKIFPVLEAGCRSTGFSFGTPFFIKYCRVGVMNDIGDIIQPDVLILLIGERPGLGRAESMSAYMAYRPKSGDTDADRDVICNIFDGGTNPLEAGAYTLQLAQKMIKKQASGVKLKQMEEG